MKRNDIRAIAFDMDGTLLNEKGQISSRIKKVLNKLKEREIELMLSTGRSYEALLPFKNELELNSPVICYNGAQVLQADGVIIRNHTIDNDISGHLVSFAREKCVHFQAYSNGTLYFEKMTPEAEAYENHVNLRGKVINFDTMKPHDFTKLMYLGAHEKLEGLSNSIKELYSGNLSVTFSNPVYLEFMPGGVSKGDALYEVAEHLGIETTNIMAFGDGDNDISMIKVAGTGVAMENATSELKSIADEVTLSNTDDGVAEFLEEFFGL
ncbi:MAG: HAD family hydrolase [Spirochaetales bacterium]|nr:HAD family hydrolase [Spirochaetales bacterium]